MREVGGPVPRSSKAVEARLIFTSFTDILLRGFYCALSVVSLGDSIPNIRTALACFILIDLLASHGIVRLKLHLFRLWSNDSR